MIELAIEPLSESEVRSYYAARLPRQARMAGRHWRIRCPFHNGKGFNFAIDAETGMWFCHSQCLRGGDVFEFELYLNGGSFPDAKRRVYELIGRDTDRRPVNPPAPRFDDRELGEAQFFQIGLGWQIERNLTTAKEEFWAAPDFTGIVAEAIRVLSYYRKVVADWSPWEAAESLSIMRRNSPGIPFTCIREAREAQQNLAAVVAGLEVNP